MEKKFKEKKRSRLAVWRLFLAGFLLGVLIPNILWKIQWQQKAIMSMYLLGTFTNGEISGFDYLLQVLRIRGSCFLLAFFCGLSVFGVPFAVLGILFAGVKIGALLSIAILQFGLFGGVIGIGLLFPQYCVYLPVGAVLFSFVYAQSLEVWKNKGLLSVKVYKYCGRAFLLAIIYMLGILLEVYCNPMIVEILVENLKIL